MGVYAQSPNLAEFHLDLHFQDTTTDGIIDSIVGRAFGYDALASDGYDAKFGEDVDYPGGLSLGNDFWFTRYDQSETRVDIMRKPLTDSFALNFSMGLSFEQYPGSIFWDTNQIPGNIKGIWIRPYYDTANDVPPLVDMKKTNIFTVPNPSQATLWGQFAVTIFYNMEPRFIPPAAVNGSGPNNGNLILEAAAFPNPMLSTGALTVTLSGPGDLSITGYDITGREVLHLTRTGNIGENTIDLSSELANAHGAIMLRIESQSGSREETKDVMLVKP